MQGLSEKPVGRKPEWFNRKVEAGPVLNRVQEILKKENLNTVCTGAKCPNRGECYSAGTATFMIMGDRCTRDCGFCAVPSNGVSSLNPEEPGAVARAALKLELDHVVVTSVTRDDLADGGAAHFRETIREVRGKLPEATIETLVPDFEGDVKSIDAVLDAGPDILNHNIETVKRLYPLVRPQADYERSLGLISRAAEAGLVTKSGFMVGLGETFDEILELLGDLVKSGCRMLTIGQYLQPGGENVEVKKYYTPREFDELGETGLKMGFSAVAAGPLVRSSYRARDIYECACSSAASVK